MRIGLSLPKFLKYTSLDHKRNLIPILFPAYLNSEPSKFSGTSM